MERMLQWESMNELHAFRLLDCDPRVTVFAEQPCEIVYFDGTETRRHYPDIYAEIDSNQGASRSPRARSNRKLTATSVLAIAMAGKSGLTQCAERSSLPGLPPARINGSGSSDRLRNAGLCHFFLHFAEGGRAECDPLIFCRHNTIIMSRAARQERSIQTR